MQQQLSLDGVRIPLAGGKVALVDVADAHLIGRPWRLHPDGYAVYARYDSADDRSVNVYLHREVLGLTRGDGLQCDHINRDRLDCRRSNLRVVTNAQNCQNRPGYNRYRGVHFDRAKGKWMARTKLNYEHRWLGLHDTEIEAARAAEAFRREHLPFAVSDESLDPVPSCRCLECRPRLRAEPRRAA